MVRADSCPGRTFVKTRRCYLCKTKVPEADAVVGQLKAFCCIEHLLEWAKSEKGKQFTNKAIRKDTKERKQKLKTRSDFTKEAQIAFNSYIRVRDRGRACVSCGAIQGDIKHGGSFDAGHYRSVGSAPHARFNVFNCHAQCKKCNNHLSGNVIEYRKSLLRIYGSAFVERLDNENTIRRFDIARLKRIKSIYNKKRRLYERRFRH